MREREIAGGHDQHPHRPRLHQTTAGGRYTGVDEKFRLGHGKEGEENAGEEVIRNGRRAKDSGPAEGRQPAAEGRERGPDPRHLQAVQVRHVFCWEEKELQNYYEQPLN